MLVYACRFVRLAEPRMEAELRHHVSNQQWPPSILLLAAGDNGPLASLVFVAYDLHTASKLILGT